MNRVMRTRTVLRRGAAIGFASGAAVVLTTGPAMAATPALVNHETIQVQLSATGDVDQAKLLSELTAVGKGTVTIEDPTPTGDLRNLDGFGQPAVKDGKAQYTLDVDGRAQERTVADFDKKLPIAVTVTYLLDGRQVEPGDVVGESGSLQVKYHVENETGTPTKVSYKDGQGAEIEDTVDVVTPLVGQLSTVLPPSFTQIKAVGAQAAGDGKGQTGLRWSMVLFEPIGKIVQDFGYTAQIDGGEVPAAEINVVPVSPKNRAELKASEDQYKETADTGGQLTVGGTLMDSSLGQLEDGTGELLSGLGQLADGADQLSDGLNNEAKPGAMLLVGGARAAHNGAVELSNGFNSPTGKPDLVSGSKQLASGLAQLSKGLNALSTTTGLPEAYAATIALRAGVDQLVAGLGSTTTSNTVLNGLAQLRAGNTGLSAGVGQIQAGADALVGPSGLPAAQDGLDEIKAGLDDALAPGGSIDQLKGGIAAAKATAGCSVDPTCVGTLNAVSQSIDGSSNSLKANTAATSAGLGQISAGLGQSIAGIGAGSTPAAATMRGGLAQVAGGLTASAAGLSQVQGGVAQVKAGLKSGSQASPGIAEGLQQLADGLTTAVGGVGQLASGAREAKSGSSELADGLADAGSGAGQLATGLGDLADGVGQFGDGIDEAASGASQLADGARAAQEGTGQLGDGLRKFRTQGVGVLVKTGNDTTKKFAKKYAVLQALDQRAETGALPYGAPEGATGNASYVFKLDGETGDGGHNVARGGAATAVFAGAGLAGALLRRRVV